MLLAPLRFLGDMAFYREAVKKSGGWLFGYLVYLGFVFALCGTLALKMKVGPHIQETVDWAASAMPTLTVSKGQITSTAAGPVMVQHPKVPVLGIMIDTNRAEAVSQQEMAEKNAVAYLTKTTLYLRPNPNKMEAYELAKIDVPQPVTLDANFYKAVGNALPKVLYPVAFFISWGVFIFWKLVATCIYSVLALILNGATSAGLEYPSLWKLSLYAQTPVVLLQMAQMFLPRPIPLFGIIGLIVAGVYLWQGIRQNKVETQLAV